MLNLQGVDKCDLDLVAKRCTSMGRKKSTDDKMKRDMEGSFTIETVSPAVEGSNDNSHTYWEVTV